MSEFANWLITALMSLVLDLVKGLLGAILSVLEYVLGLCGVCISFNVAWFSNAFGSIGSYVWYFASAIDLGLGVRMIICAYAIRFLIRRLPFVG